MEKYPRYAYTKHGLVRITHYEDGKFHVVGRGDERRVLTREQLSFRRSGLRVDRSDNSQ